MSDTTLPLPTAHGMVEGKRYSARVKSTGAEILGTSETLLARSEIAFFFTDPEFDGSGVGYEHAGDTEVFWECCKTQTVGNRIVYLCSDGMEWTADQLEFTEITDE